MPFNRPQSFTEPIPSASGPVTETTLTNFLSTFRYSSRFITDSRTFRGVALTWVVEEAVSAMGLKRSLQR